MKSMKPMMSILFFFLMAINILSAEQASAKSAEKLIKKQVLTTPMRAVNPFPSPKHRISAAPLDKSKLSLKSADARLEEAQESFFDKIKMGSAGSFGEENIDYYGGGVTLTYTDIHLPGPNGFDLVIQRVYNSKIFKDSPLGPPTITSFQSNPNSWVGFGWSMHMGRVFNWDPNQPYSAPVIEFPDGHSEKAYPPKGTDPANDKKYKTRSFLEYSKADHTLRFPDGTRWVFCDPSKAKTIHHGYYNLGSCLLVEKIINPQGFTITISYAAAPDNPNMTQIVDALGRIVYFETTTGSLDTRLTRIYYQSGMDGMNPEHTEYLYDVDSYTTAVAYFRLNSFTPPDLGAAVLYEYYDDSLGSFPKYELKKITTPFGGEVTYDYKNEEFHYFKGEIINTRVMNSKTIRFAAGEAVSSWNIVYPSYYDTPGTPYDPDNRIVHIYGPEFDTHMRYHTFRVIQPGEPDYNEEWNTANEEWWLVGSLQKKWITEKRRDIPLYSEDYEYQLYVLCDNPLFHEELANYGDLAGWKFPIVAKLPFRTTVSKIGDPTVITQHGYVLDPAKPKFWLTDYCLPVQVCTWIVNQNNQEQMVGFQQTEYFIEKPTAAVFLNRHMVNYPSSQSNSFVLSYDPASQVITYHIEEETAKDYYTDPLQPEFGLVKTESKLIDIVDNGSGPEKTFTDWHISYPTVSPQLVIKKVDLPGPAGIETYEYHAGQLAKYEKPLNESGTSTYVIYNKTICPFTSRVLSETNQHGGLIQYNYDKLGRITAIDLPDSQPENFGDISVVWNLNHVLITQSSGSGTITVKKLWDGMNRDLGLEEQSNNPLLLLYSRKNLDAEGRVISETKASKANNLAHAFEYSYNAIGLITEIKDPLYKTQGKKTIYAYGDREKQVTDIENRTTVFRSTFLPGLATEVIDPENRKAINTFDILGRLTSSEYNGERSQVFSYNLLGNLSYETHPESGIIQYAYDDAHNLRLKAWDNSRIQFSYSAANQVSEQKVYSISDPGNPEELITYTYDTQGRVSDISSSQGWHRGQFTYNALGSLLQEIQTIPPLTAQTTSYAYDGCNNIKSITYPSGRTVLYQNNDFNLPSAVHFSTPAKTIVSDIIYGANKQLERIVYGNNTSLESSYDLLGRSDEVVLRNNAGMGSTLLKFKYGYDGVGNITAITDLNSNDLNVSFAYDIHNRLLSAQYNDSGTYNKSYQYTYDPYGNLLSTMDGTKSAYFAYNGKNQHQDGTISYDAKGNVIMDEDYNYQRDLQNRMTSMVHKKSSTALGNFLYDERGLRLRAERLPQNQLFLITPQAGDVLAATHTYPIYWHSFNSEDDVKVEYYNGASWQMIAAATPNTGHVDWTIDNVSTSQARIRISNLTGTVLCESEDDFSIVPSSALSLNLITLNSGETILKNQQVAISWIKTGTSDPVKVEFSANGGLTYTTLLSATDESTYWWTVPGTLSANCLIRISTSRYSRLSQVSHAPFNIIVDSEPKITVISPNGGEYFETQSSQTISWNAQGAVHEVILEYFNGSDWQYIGTAFAKTGSFSWQLPETPIADSQIRIKNAVNPSQYDSSDGVFQIIAAGTPSLTITAPKGGEIFTLGSDMTIFWVSSGTVGNIKIELSRNGGADYETIIASAANTGTANWTISGAESANCCVRIGEAADNDPMSYQSGIFSIAAVPAIQITAPTAGELLYKGDSYSICWNASPQIPYLRIEFSDDNGQNYSLITDYTANDGTYQWLVPQVNSQQCLLKMSAYNDPTITANSGLFSIGDLPTLTITSPNGGESLAVNSVHTINWNSTGIIGNVKLEYSYDQGTNYYPIPGAESIPDNSQFNWTVPACVSDYCLIKISALYSGGPMDVSDNQFSIITSSGPFVELIKDINPGASNNSTDNDHPYEFTIFNNTLYFKAITEDDGRELWKYNGIDEPTMVYDINPGDGYAFKVSLGDCTKNYKRITEFNGKLYFSAYSSGQKGSESDEEIWSYDGQNAPSLVYDIYPDGYSSNPSHLYVFNNQLFFNAIDDYYGEELFKYSGTGNPVMVPDFNSNFNLNPWFLIEFNSKLYFWGDILNKGRELAVYTPSTNALSLVYDINPNSYSSDPFCYSQFLIKFNNKLIFAAKQQSTGVELWQYTGSGTPTIIADLNPGSGSSIDQENCNPIIFNNELYFQARGESYEEIWKWDGDITHQPVQITDFNRTLPKDRKLRTVFNEFAVLNNKLLFLGYNESGKLLIHEYDGATVTPLTGAIPYNYAGQFKVFNNVLYFSAHANVYGEELWMYDGSNPPTILVDIYPANLSSEPKELFEYQGQLYFSAFRPDVGRELFRLSEPSMTITAPAVAASWEIGSTQNIEWTGKGINGTVTLDLYKNSTFIQNIMVVPFSDTSYAWEIDEFLEPGNDYQIYIHQGDVSAFSGQFALTSPITVKPENIVGHWSGIGTWIFEVQQGLWTKWSSAGVIQPSIGDFDGDGFNDLMGIFNNKVWYRYATGTWQEQAVNITNLLQLRAGDINGDGRSDIIGNWSDIGLWWRNSATLQWTKLSAQIASHITLGDVDGNGRCDIIGRFTISGTTKIWIWYDNGTWQSPAINPNLTLLECGDINGDGKFDIIGSWPETEAAKGVWWTDISTGTWVRLHATPALSIFSADLDLDGLDDLIGTWGNISGFWVRYTGSGSWVRLHNTAPVCFTAGAIEKQIPPMPPLAAHLPTKTNSRLLTFQSVGSNGLLQLSWQPLPDCASYQVRLKDQASEEWQSHSVCSSSFATSQLAPLTAYHWQVDGVNHDGNIISQSPVRSFFTTNQYFASAPQPPAESSLSADIGKDASMSGRTMPSPETKIYIYGLANQLLAEYNGAGECVKEYIYLGSKLAAEYSPTDNQFYYYTTDQINSSRLITDDSGTVFYHAAHGPYGDIQKTFINTKDPSAKFSGKERESYSNLDYFGARYYSNRTARFDAIDPIMNKDEALVNPQLWNLYAYCGNNPVRYLDPDGNVLLTTELARMQEIVGPAAPCIKIINGQLDVSGLTQNDLETNEGAALLYDLATSSNSYSYSEGNTVNTQGGVKPVRSVINLDNKHDSRLDRIGGKRPGSAYFPVNSDSAVVINPNVSFFDFSTKSKMVSREAVAFHELAEAYGRVDKKKQYVEAHQFAIDRENKLIQQRSDFTQYPAGGHIFSKNQ